MLLMTQDDVVEELRKQADDLEMVDPGSHDAQVLLVAADLIQRMSLQRAGGARLLKADQIWETDPVWIEFISGMEGGPVRPDTRTGGLWKLSSGPVVYLLEERGYGRSWRCWDREPTLKEKTEAEWK